MQLRRDCSTAIGDQGYKVSQIAGVADSGFDALVGVHADDVERADTEIVEDVVKVSRGEYATGGLVDYDLITDWRDFLEKTRFARARGSMQFQSFVSLAPVSAITGEGLDPDMDYFQTVGAKAVLEIVDAWQHCVSKPVEVVAHLVQRNGRVLVIPEQAIALSGVEILHIDAEQSRIPVAQIFLMLGVLNERFAVDRTQRIS